MRRERVGALLLMLLLIVVARVGHIGFRWYAHADERAQIRVLQGDLEAAGVAVVRTQLGADSLRAEVQRLDGELRELRRAVRRYDRRAHEGMLPWPAYGAYRQELDAYNRRVRERNARFDAWRSVVVRNHEAVSRFNVLADSVRRVAGRMGEPYFPIPTPAELALKHGIRPPSP